jgi:hypothetical protein
VRREWPSLVLVVLALGSLALWPPSATAYRPFDSTDADVAGDGEAELELGPVGFLRQGPDRFLVAPAVIGNYGISGDREIVLEGKLFTRAGDGQDESRSVLGDTALSLKQVHRRGALQDETGPSLASECSVLLPEIHRESGTGAGCTGIMSNAWPFVTTHLNMGLFRERDHTWNRIVGLIVEGPREYLIRPVMEILSEHGNDGSSSDSVLVGFIWKQTKNLSWDAAVRTGRASGQNIQEFRLGLTWSFVPFSTNLRDGQGGLSELSERHQ